mgnify:CR=1 FL=1|tara:strand:+ start:5843 stop:6091 length:249 start_codon:yes stop_codon:yes gene_type:complete
MYLNNYTIYSKNFKQPEFNFQNIIIFIVLLSFFGMFLLVKYKMKLNEKKETYKMFNKLQTIKKDVKNNLYSTSLEKLKILHR